MRNRLIVLMATVALLLVGAVPVSAAPGGVPGPPPGHGKSGDNGPADDVATPEDGEREPGPPEWAPAFGRRIMDTYGIPFGHLQQCIRAADDGDVVDGDDAGYDDQEDVKRSLEYCDDLDDYEVPEEPGARAFAVFNGLWVMPEAGLPILAL